MSLVKPFVFNDLKPGEECARLIQWKVQPGTHVERGAIVGIYRPIIDSNSSNKNPLDPSSQPLCGPERKIKAIEFGVVVDLFKRPNDILKNGESLLTYEPCSHPIQMKDLCAECGQDLRLLAYSGRELAAARSVASVSMVHSIPELKVSKEQAEKLGKADEKRLISSRKLVLLVDLDQTLIHTTNDPVPETEFTSKECHTFQLARHSPVYRTRVRPHTQKFLEEIDRLYEMHICTFGARLYAHRIANILDPPPSDQATDATEKDKKSSNYMFNVVGSHKFFSHRILSRDECLDPLSKTGNIKMLFPSGDSMVAIIDDREDVWTFAPNLIQVTPYVYFRGTGDINAPDKKLETNDRKGPISESSAKGNNVITKVDSLETRLESVSDLVSRMNDPDNDNPKMRAQIEDRDGKTIETSDLKAALETVKDSDITIEDTDDYLLYLIDILKRIHTAFYEEFDDMNAHVTADEPVRMPDLKKILPTLKRKVLAGVNISFSSVIPHHYPAERSRVWRVAKALGANPQKEIITTPNHAQKTTHLLAGKMGTSKVHQAVATKGCIKIVNPLWLYTCNERWERVDETIFAIEKDDDYTDAKFRASVGLSADQEHFIVGSQGRGRTSLSQIPQDDENLSMEKNDSTSKCSQSSSRDKGAARTTVRYDEKTGKRIRGEGETNYSNTSATNTQEDSTTEQLENIGSKMSDFSPLSVFTFSDLRKMDKEVEDAVSEASGDTGEDGSSSSGSESGKSAAAEEESPGKKRKRKATTRPRELEEDSSSSSEASLTGEFPKGWATLMSKGKCAKKQRLHSSKSDHYAAQRLGTLAGDEPDEPADDDEDTRDWNFEARSHELFGSNSSSQEDAESIGSVDEEMAAEVEKQFLASDSCR